MVRGKPVVRHVAELRTDIPYDAIEEDGEIVQYPGKAVAEAVAEILRGLGCEVFPPVDVDVDVKGWELNVRYKGRQLYGRAGYLNEVILVLWDPSWINELLGRHHPKYLEILRRFADQLRLDSRFHDVRWFSGDEVDTGVEGAVHPV